MRQQLLAHYLECNHVHGADSVRVIHVLSPANTAYQSLASDECRAIGGTVDEVWDTLLHAHDRFSHLDPAIFLEPEITSPHYTERYAG